MKKEKERSDKKSQAVILIASAIPEIRKQWSHGLQDFYSIQEATKWENLRWSMTNHSPSVLLLDLALLQPNGNRIGSIFDLQRLSPSTKIILLASVCDEKEAINVFKTGVKGYCNKDIDPPLLKKAVEVVQKGEVWIGRKTISHFLSELTSHTVNRQKDPPSLSEVCLDYLTPREHQIARLVGDGAHNKEIARGLNISERTVKAHLTAIFQKLQIPDRLRLGLFVANHNRNSVNSRPPRPKSPPTT